MRVSLRTMSYGNSNLFESGNLMPNGSSISSIKIRLSAKFHSSPLIVIALSSYLNLFLNFCFVFSKLNSAYSFSFCVVKYLFRLVLDSRLSRAYLNMLFFCGTPLYRFNRVFSKFMSLKFNVVRSKTLEYNANLELDLVQILLLFLSLF
jgi:hypothetical protein